MPAYDEIPRFPAARWEVDVFWRDLPQWLDRHVAGEFGPRLDLNPDFQRGHVWSDEQRTAYVEYVLRGGEVGKTLIFNHSTWDKPGVDGEGAYEILDGLQRLTAALKFLRGEIPAFGLRAHQWSGPLRHYAGFKWRILSLESRADILRFYLDMNAGGTPHAAAEIERVRALLQQENGEKR
jgi:hypothetical protein